MFGDPEQLRPQFAGSGDAQLGYLVRLGRAEDNCLWIEDEHENECYEELTCTDASNAFKIEYAAGAD